MHLSPGIKLRARGLIWDVLAAEPCGTQTRLRLRCAEGDLAGLTWDLLHPWERVEPIQADPRPNAPARVTDWWLHHLARLLDREPGFGALLSDHAGRVAVEPYQLVPVLRAMDMPRPRLLLADAVGLGKTIQAGMIAAELIVRRRAHRIIVVTPAGPLLTQWARELRVRFGLRATVLADAPSLRGLRRTLELGGNPFDATALCLTSIDFAKQEPVLAELERSAWDLAIIDEAHHCASTGGADTRRRRLAEVLAARSDGLLLLTATPHDGNDAHFASLMGLLDPRLVDGAGRLLGQAYRHHVVRRLKAHIRDPHTGRPLFRARIVTPVPITLSPETDAAALAFHRALTALIAPRLGRKSGSGPPAETLAFVGLLKRSVSTLRACVETLAVVADRHAAFAAGDDNAASAAGGDEAASAAGGDEAASAAGNNKAAIRRERTRALRAYRRRLARDGVLSAAEERDQAELEAQGMAAELHAIPTNDTARHLRALIRLGEAAAAEDPKLRALAAHIAEIRSADPDANILVFTEYTDSQDAATAWLRDDPALAGTILTIGGADPDDRRAEAADRFASGSPIILISTDSMAEGLNLHQRCRHLIHLDLPYNPNRLEQRNGRIDRYGQRRDPDIRYPYLVGTFEERLLLRLIAKYEQARLALDVMPDTLGATADAAALAPGLVAGFAQDQASLFPPHARSGPSPIRGLDRLGEETGADAYRGLLGEIDRAYASFEQTALRHGWLTGLGATSATRLPREARQAIVATTPLGFLTTAIEAAGGIVRTESGDGAEQGGAAPLGRDLRLFPPPDWNADLSGLPGHDPATGSLRATADPDRFRDDDGRELACPGWAHPLVRRAAARLRVETTTGPDPRIAVATSRSRTAPAVLLTYLFELFGARGTVLRDIIAVHLPRAGRVHVLSDPTTWLALAERPAARSRIGARSDPDIWPDLFAPWVRLRQPEAHDIATRAAAATAHRFAMSQGTMLAREGTTLSHWLDRRAAEIAGPWSPPVPDLFGFVPDLPEWKKLPTPLDRLAAFTADATNPPDRRHAAQAAVTLFLERSQAMADREASRETRLTPIGMLMLVPSEP